MKKMLFVAMFGLLFVLSGCVNQALLDSATAYQESTKPYLEMVLEGSLISDGEKESLRVNMSEFEKTIKQYQENKPWYEL